MNLLERATQMKHLIATILIVLTIGGIALGQPKPAAPAKPAEKPIPDLCKGVIDPYDVSGEKALFFAAAGVDNELTSSEFGTAKGKDKTFARKFDSWRTLITFDKDKNGTIDWNEASEYRLETRRKVMGSFDKNKDGKLAGEERTAANKALAAGRLSLSSRGADRAARTAKWRADMLAKYDTDKDGKLSKDEEGARRKAYEAAARERMERYREQRDLREHDSDKDGKLNETESAARDKANAGRDKERADREKRIKEFVAKFDKDGDGRLTGAEREAAAPAFREAMRKRMIAQYDKNGDGELSKEEEGARQKEWDKRRQQFRDRYELQRYDKNKDGKLDGEETAARDKGRKDRETERAKRMAEYVKKYDKNGDGKVDDKERPSRGSSGRGRGRGGPGRGGPSRGGDRGGPPRGDSRER
jgi:Ca2+-binding EF-hand superfamily protein